MLPGVQIKKGISNVGVQLPSNLGILAVIACCSGAGLPANTAKMYTSDSQLNSDCGYGPLVEIGAYDLDQTGKPVVVVKSSGSNPGTYGTVVHTGVTGTSIPSAGGTTPFDDYNLVVKIIAGGTVGVAGITFQYALDGGASSNSFSAIQYLGAANSIVIANTGITISLAAGTLLAGDTFSCVTARPTSNDSDLTAALAALVSAKIPFETVFVDMVATATEVATLDTWLAARDNEGRYYTGALNAVYQGATSASAYQTALQTTFATATSDAIMVGADACQIISPFFGVFLQRPAIVPVVVRGMSLDIAVDAAFVAAGNLPNCRIYDNNLQPLYHDELKNPGLDDLRLVTLRTWEGRNGVYVNNPKLISGTGSPYIYWQHARVMKYADGITFAELTIQCSIGVHTQPNPQNPNVQNIAEPDAQKIEGQISKKLAANLVPKRATSASFTCSRNDDMTSNGPQTLTGTQQIGALRYVKSFVVNTTFV